LDTVRFNLDPAHAAAAAPARYVVDGDSAKLGEKLDFHSFREPHATDKLAAQSRAPLAN